MKLTDSRLRTVRQNIVLVFGIAGLVWLSMGNGAAQLPGLPSLPSLPGASEEPSPTPAAAPAMSEPPRTDLRMPQATPESMSSQDVQKFQHQKHLDELVTTIRNAFSQ